MQSYPDDGVRKCNGLSLCALRMLTTAGGHCGWNRKEEGRGEDVKEVAGSEIT